MSDFMSEIKSVIENNSNKEGFQAGYHTGAASIVAHFIQVAQNETNPEVVKVLKREGHYLSRLFLEMVGGGK